MASKWAALKSKVPEFVEERSYQQKVDEAKQLLLGTLSGKDANIERLAAMFQQRRKLKAKHEEEIYGLNVEINALSQLLIEAYEDEGIENSTLTSGGTGYIGYTPWVRINDERAFYAWLHKQGMDELRKINAQTLKGMVSEKVLEDLSAGREPKLPPGTEFKLGKQFRIVNGNKEE